MTLADLERLAGELKKVAIPITNYRMPIPVGQARMMWKSIQKYYNIEESLDEIMALGDMVGVGDFLIYDDKIRMRLKEEK